MSSLEAIAAEGTREQLQAALDAEGEKWMARRSASAILPGHKSKSCTPLSGNPDCFTSKAAAIRSIVNQVYGCHAVSGTKLIDHAATKGNVDVVRYLLELGAYPSGNGDEYPTLTIFFRCSKPTGNGWLSELTSVPVKTLRSTERVVEAYDLLISAGADIHFVIAKQTALHRCKDPDVINLLLSRGADPDVGSIAVSPPSGGGTPLDYQVFQYFVHPNHNNSADALSIVRALSRAAKSRRLSKWTERNICNVCAAGKLATDCQEFRQYLDVRNESIFQAHAEPLDERARWRYCDAVVDER